MRFVCEAYLDFRIDMRDINRIPVVCKNLEKAWEQYPDFRFGQFIEFFVGWCYQNNKCEDIFFPEDMNWNEWLKEFIEEKENSTKE